MRRKPSNWKEKYIKKEKVARKSNPDLKKLKYTCTYGHIRVEAKKLTDSELSCPACNLGGKLNSKFRFVGSFNISSHQYKTSKFNVSSNKVDKS
ncbi:hypothetical protein [Paenibacillus crassostreae]|uniref:Uncharacterized protein n=1 Tax=Paenibacillus crassostreae TaxID=1763538 RepID=A0A167AUZ9_9BACL|nr:hypothetical protein [Paenibacillus crassostreae]AOZ93637.1 hypothetical protein LPB68_16510 [Paenibacillus crassostreae]OAB71464.1 hypothetical protein PNBC_19380 [Paenibacillus crassostreae]